MAARSQSNQLGWVRLDFFRMGYIKKHIMATWRDRWTRVTGGPKMAVYKWYRETRMAKGIKKRPCKPQGRFCFQMVSRVQACANIRFTVCPDYFSVVVGRAA